MQEKNLSKGNILALLKKNKADENWEVIEQYLIAGGVGIELTELQQRMLERWQFIDEKLRQSKYRRYEIWSMVSVRFGVSVDTARRDMVGAEYVFASTSPLNKKYKIAVRIEFLERQINLAAASNDYKAVAMLESTLQKYYDIYPDAPPPRAPKNIILNFSRTVVEKDTIETLDAEFIINKEIENGSNGTELE